MTGGRPVAPFPGGPAPAVFFLSDYGTEDEFVGVVHAVLHRLCPGTAVIDLGHQVPSFNVAAGASMLRRCASQLGIGVVLAVVDPGVGTTRRPVALRVTSPGPEWLIGPDNGLLVPLTAALGGVDTALHLDSERLSGSSVPGTFDGRDVFAPAAAHLVRGEDPDRIGVPFDPATLVGPPPPPGWAESEEPRHPEDGAVSAVVGWIDRFGNVQLELGPAALVGLDLAPGGAVSVTVADRPVTRRARWVQAFAELDRDELGLVVDSSGHVALVVDRDSAAHRLGGVPPGTTVRLAILPQPDRG